MHRSLHLSYMSTSAVLVYMRDPYCVTSVAVDAVTRFIEINMDLVDTEARQFVISCFDRSSFEEHLLNKIFFF